MNDRRVHHAVLTATGLEALREAHRHHVRTVQRLFTDDLDEQELQVLRRVFTRLRSRLHDAGAHVAPAHGDDVSAGGDSCAVEQDRSHR